ncbi:ABC transporter ATP-binding protein [Burkholderia cepacia]|uniref:ABC transporter ATP-binding protein n=1 Tax=Burkholderia cepacia TaxID=292 RepID=UPI002AB5E385|nr:ABC transporter ATP-binding protein [Burkholderia cepacia]
MPSPAFSITRSLAPGGSLPRAEGDLDVPARLTGTCSVSVRGLRKSFGDSTILHDVDLDVYGGEFLAIVGPSGCGKSTLLKLLAGLDEPDGGDIVINGASCRGLEPRARNVAMVFQNHALYPHMTARQNIALPLKMRRLSRWQRLPGAKSVSPATRQLVGQINREVTELARSLSIEHLLSRKPSQLSGGQRQRVAVARAMIRHPAVFLMDEPLSSLDAKLRVEMRAEISALHRRLGVAFIYVTHDQSEAMTMADRVAVMSEGRILQIATPRTLYANPNHLAVAQLVGTPTINCLRVEGQFAQGTLGRALEATPHATVACIRPEHIGLAPASGPGISAVVVAIEDHGADLFVRLALPNDETVLMRGSPLSLAVLCVGRATQITLREDEVLFFDAQGHRVLPGGSQGKGS